MKLSEGLPTVLLTEKWNLRGTDGHGVVDVHQEDDQLKHDQQAELNLHVRFGWRNKEGEHCHERDHSSW